MWLSKAFFPSPVSWAHQGGHVLGSCSHHPCVVLVMVDADFPALWTSAQGSRKHSTQICVLPYFNKINWPPVKDAESCSPAGTIAAQRAGCFMMGPQPWKQQVFLVENRMRRKEAHPWFRFSVRKDVCHSTYDFVNMHRFTAAVSLSLPSAWSTLGSLVSVAAGREDAFFHMSFGCPEFACDRIFTTNKQLVACVHVFSALRGWLLGVGFQNLCQLFLLSPTCEMAFLEFLRKCF